MAKHVVITGTGRTGTTFIVQLLTYLGLDTGFSIDNMPIYRLGRAGLEQDIKKTNAPYIIKAPWFIDHIEEIFMREDIQIERIFIPMRDLYAAAESRRYVTRKSKEANEYTGGGLWDADKPHEQENVLMMKLYKLILDISNTEIPITLLQYPRLVKDSTYLYDKLKSILNGVSYDKFQTVFKEIIRPSWIHDFRKEA